MFIGSNALVELTKLSRLQFKPPTKKEKKENKKKEA